MGEDVRKYDHIRHRSLLPIIPQLRRERIPGPGTHHRVSLSIGH
jgi:hypothetical protein